MQFLRFSKPSLVCGGFDGASAAGASASAAGVSAGGSASVGFCEVLSSSTRSSNLALRALRSASVFAALYAASMRWSSGSFRMESRTASAEVGASAGTVCSSTGGGGSSALASFPLRFFIFPLPSGTAVAAGAAETASTGFSGSGVASPTSADLGGSCGVLGGSAAAGGSTTPSRGASARGGSAALASAASPTFGSPAVPSAGFAGASSAPFLVSLVASFGGFSASSGISMLVLDGSGFPARNFW